MCYLEYFLNKKKGESKRYEIDSSRMARANPFSFFFPWMMLLHFSVDGSLTVLLAC